MVEHLPRNSAKRPVTRAPGSLTYHKGEHQGYRDLLWRTSPSKQYISILMLCHLGLFPSPKTLLVQLDQLVS